MTDFEKLLQALGESKVRFIIVGGAAAVAHGSSRLTQDLDVVYDRAPDNLQKLVEALSPVNPYLRGAPPGLPFVLDIETLGHGLNFTLQTDVGDIDLLGEIVGGGGYKELSDHGVEMTLFGQTCRILSLSKLIDVKRAAGRPKDLEVIAELELIRDRA